MEYWCMRHAIVIREIRLGPTLCQLLHSTKVEGIFSRGPCVAKSGNGGPCVAKSGNEVGLEPKYYVM